MPPAPKGPASDPKYPPSTALDNPYNFTPQLLAASTLPPKTTNQYIFFFGYEGSDPLVCLQQWYPVVMSAPRHPYRADDTETTFFPTTEHYMMYHKALLMADEEIANQILAPENAHPSRAKALGRQVRSFDVKIWQQHADRVVTEANYYKFSQDEELKAVLLGTGDRVLVEASPDDRIWGIGFDAEHAEGREDEWGENRLGKALMEVRWRLRERREKGE